MKKLKNYSTSTVKATIKSGQLYQHYKGKSYRIIGMARHSETLEELVVYQALYETEFGKDSLWVRPKSMFLENVIIDGVEKRRFRLIN